jgi:putative transposase
VYHVLNRANGRRTIFEKDGDYRAFEDMLAEVRERVPLRILAWCLMPNHWHLVLWPQHDGELSLYLRLLTVTHAQRWHAHRHTAGSGHLYQGRFKSFIVQTDSHFLTVCRYVEANALRAKLVARAESWRWGSLWRTCRRRPGLGPPIDEWPLPRPSTWTAYVNECAPGRELADVRSCAQRGTPYGSTGWMSEVAKQFGLHSTMRPRGRPRKVPDPFFSDAPADA